MRIDRGCPRSLIEPERWVGVPRRDPCCPVLEIPGWIWSAWEIGALIEAGSLGPGEVDARTWEIARVAYSMRARARAAVEAAHERKRAMLARAGVRER